MPRLAGSVFSSTALVGTVTNVRTDDGRIVAGWVYNPNGSASYLQIFNALAADVTLGTTVPTSVVGIAANTGSPIRLENAYFSTAISVAGTTTPTGNTAVSTGLVVQIIHEPD